MTASIMAVKPWSMIFQAYIKQIVITIPTLVNWIQNSATPGEERRQECNNTSWLTKSNIFINKNSSSSSSESEDMPLQGPDLNRRKRNPFVIPSTLQTKNLNTEPSKKAQQTTEDPR
ncbi:hypothetical protein BDC45DRAFT_553470 [Circinella umbellata]|nr:hypothetical protein BDC45DRAFT_553470 [Circinella umbellata]